LWRGDLCDEDAIRTFRYRVGVFHHADPYELFFAGRQGEQRRYRKNRFRGRIDFGFTVSLRPGNDLDLVGLLPLFLVADTDRILGV
jgi:hypothetical protein